MPIGRYFGFVGSLLLILLFVTDWYFPSPVSGQEVHGIDKTVIRIASARRWPDRIVFDTTQPTIVPPQNIVAAGTPTPNPPREAFAQLTAPSSKTTVPEIIRKKSKIAKRRPFIKTAVFHQNAPIYEPVLSGW